MVYLIVVCRILVLYFRELVVFEGVFRDRLYFGLLKYGLDIKISDWMDINI